MNQWIVTSATELLGPELRLNICIPCFVFAAFRGVVVVFVFWLSSWLDMSKSVFIIILIVEVVLSSSVIAEEPTSNCAVPTSELLSNAGGKLTGSWIHDPRKSGQRLGAPLRLPLTCFWTDLKFGIDEIMTLTKPESSAARKCRAIAGGELRWGITNSALAPGERTLLVKSPQGERRFSVCLNTVSGKPVLTLTTISEGQEGRPISLVYNWRPDD